MVRKGIKLGSLPYGYTFAVIIYPVFVASEYASS